MRIKISALTDSTTNCDFWYVVDDKAAQHDTIDDLRKKINNTLPLATKAKHLNLSLEGFQLLPTSPLNGLIRDGDTIRAELDAGKLENKKKVLVPKRPSTLANNTKNRKVDKNKTKKPTAQKKKDDTKMKPEKRKRKDVATEQTSTVDTNVKRRKKDKTKKPDTKDTSATTTTSTVSKSKARNLRRAKTRMARRENKLAAKAEQPVENDNRRGSATESTHAAQPGIDHKHKDDDDEPPTETSSKAHVNPPHHLIKKNKNKKKDFLKQMNRNAPSKHIVFGGGDDAIMDDDKDDDAVVMMDIQDDGAVVEHNNDPYEAPQEDEVNDEQQLFYDVTNTYGGAFITESESQHVRNNNKQQRRNYMNRHYPVDALDPVFLAIDDEQEEDEKVAKDDSSSSSSSDSDSSSSEEEEDDDDEEKVDQLMPEPGQTKEPERVEKVDYEQYPAITFGGLYSPVVGDHLAIKTLHLSDSYTPEISDWKEVIVVELTGQEMVVDYVGQQRLSQVNVQSGRLRKFDLPPEHELQQTDDADGIFDSISYHNVLDMRRISI